MSQPQPVPLDEVDLSDIDRFARNEAWAQFDTLRREAGMAFLFVSHDLNVVRMMCERMIVMKGGKIVEAGPSERLFHAPQAAYTKELIAAIPVIDFNAPVPEAMRHVAAQ